MTTLITGGAGFAGSHLLELVARDRDVVAWARSAPPPQLAPLARWQQVDLLDAAAVRRAIAEITPSAVYHCAGLPHVAESFADSARTLRVNVFGTHHLLDALRRAGAACRVLVPGSATVYAHAGHPIGEDHDLAPASPYARSKLAQEQLTLRGAVEDGIEPIVTRSFNHVGPRQEPAFAAPSFARQIALIEQGRQEPVIRVGNLDTRRDITDVRDVVRAYAQLVDRGTPGTVYNVCSGVGRSGREVLDGLLARARVTVRVELDPARLRQHDIPVLVGDAARLRRATGWQPAISFDRMLDDLLAYWRGVAAQPNTP